MATKPVSIRGARGAGGWTGRTAPPPREKRADRIASRARIREMFKKPEVIEDEEKTSTPAVKTEKA
jgi:hypothetical protein